MSMNKKSGPITGATRLKRQKGGKSGKTLQGVALTSRTTFLELSKTMGCGEGHSLSAASFVVKELCTC
jgi:hypothetical protein